MLECAIHPITYRDEGIFATVVKYFLARTCLTKSSSQANDFIRLTTYLKTTEKQRVNKMFTRCKRNSDYGLFCKKGFLSAILFTELFKLISYELNFRTDYNLNRIFTRSDHTGNTG